MKKGNFAGLLVRAILFCFFLGASRGRAQNNPLAILDFEKSLQINLTVVGQVPEIVSLAGGRAACLSAQRLSVPVHWSADMPNPGFPGLAEKMGKPIVARPRLVLDLDQKVLGLNGPVDLALVITVYDLCRVNRDRQKILVELVRNDEKRSTLQVSFATSGDPFASDTLLQPRWLRKTLVAPGVLLVDRQEGGDIVISPEDRVLIRRIEVYRLPGSPLEERISRRLPEMVSYPGYLPPVSCLDLWRRDFSDLMVAQAKSYAGRAEAEEWLRLFQRHLFWTRKKPLPEDFQARGRYLDTLVESSLLEMDEFFYEGKIALIREDTVSYRRLLDTVTNTLHQVEVASSQLRTKIEAEYRRNFPSVSFQPAAVSHKERRLEEVDSPENRVTFLCFANSPWDYWDPYNATGRFLHYYGINTKGYLAGGLSLNESGQVNPSSLRHLLQTIDRERACGFDVAIGVGHHGYHLTEHGNLPAWLAQKSGKDSLYDLDFYGRPQKYMDIWNPLVRQYFQNSLQALTREVLSAPHVFRYFYFGEPQCASGYTRWGRQAFREYLKKKYGSLSSLNALWKTNYESFEAIEPPPPPGEKLRIQPSGLTYEFETFRRESFNEWWQMAREALRQGNSEAKLWFEGWGRFDYLLRHGMDQLGTFQRADMAAVHSGAASEVQRVWGYSLSRVTGTLLCDGETITSGDYYQGGCASLQQLAAAAQYHLLAHVWFGARAFMFWTGTLTMNRVYSYGGPYLYDGDYLSPVSSSSAAVALVRRKADLYEPILATTKIVHPQVGILFSSTSFVNSWPYNEVEHETYPFHAWLHQSDFGYFYLHEDLVADGREDLMFYKVILAPWAIWLKPEAASRLLAWVHRGGTLIASGPIGAFDQYGQPLNTILKAVFGPVQVSYGGHERTGENLLSAGSVALLRSLGDTNTTHFGGWYWKIDFSRGNPEVKILLSLTDGTPILYQVPAGYGKVLLATGPLGKNGLRRLVMKQIEEKVVPLVQKSKDDGFLVVPRMDSSGRLYLGIFNQNVSERVEGLLRVDGFFNRVMEKTLAGDFPVPTRFENDRTCIALSLEPGESTVLCLGERLSPYRRGREIQSSVTPERPLVDWNEERATSVLEKLKNRKMPASVKAETLALTLAARRQAGAGYLERARRLLSQAEKITAVPPRVISPGDLVVARRVKQPVVVDGLAGEWRDVPRYQVKGTEKSGGEFALQWDEKNLYLLAVVRDSSLKKIEEEGGDFNWLWAYDGLLMVMNTARTSPLTVAGALYDAKYRANQTALLVSITGRKYANSSGVFSAAGVRSQVKEIPNGYVMEVAIPCQGLMLPAMSAAEVDFAFSIMDDGREMAFEEFSDRENWQFDTSHFACLRLED